MSQPAPWGSVVVLLGALDDELKKRFPEVQHRGAGGIVPGGVLCGLVEPEVQEFGKAVIPGADGVVMLRIFRSLVDLIAEAVNDGSCLVCQLIVHKGIPAVIGGSVDSP